MTTRISLALKTTSASNSSNSSQLRELPIDDDVDSSAELIRDPLSVLAKVKGFGNVTEEV